MITGHGRPQFRVLTARRHRLPPRRRRGVFAPRLKPGTRIFKIAVRSTQIFLLLGVLGAVELAARTGHISKFVLPAPSSIARALPHLVASSEFAADLEQSAIELGLAAVIATVPGVIVGLVLGRWSLAGRVLEPFLSTLYAVPLLVFYPVLLVMMGIGWTPIVAISATAAFVPVSMNTLAGVRTLSPTYRKLARSLNCNRPQTYFQVLLPAMVPLLVPGIQIGLIVALVYTIAMEFLVAVHGLGFRISYSYTLFQMVATWANIVAVVVISIALSTMISAAGRRIRQDLE